MDHRGGNRWSETRNLGYSWFETFFSGMRKIDNRKRKDKYLFPRWGRALHILERKERTVVKQNLKEM